jgi:hypothetical protein
MTATRKLVSSLMAVAALCALVAGCGSAGDSFSGAKEALLGTPAPTPDLPERPKLVMPPANAPLPVPGQAASAPAQWAPSAQQPNQQAADAAAKPRESSGWFSGLFGSDDKKTQ